MMKNGLSYRAVMGMAVGSIILISFVIYKDMLTYTLIGSDAFTFIEKGRIESVSDITRIFSEAVFEGTAFSKLGKFYRPILVLDYGLDYFIWQLNPFGYHLTDFVLHILISVLVFFFVLFLTNGKMAEAYLSAVIFTVHPIHIKIIPLTASSRQELTFTFFMIITFLALFTYHRMIPRKGKYLFFSFICYLLALGSKETAIIFLPLILIYSLLFYYVPEKSIQENLLIAIKSCSLLIIATIIYIAWRTYVLKGLGGYVVHNSGFMSFVKPSDYKILVYIQIIIYIIISYFSHLLLPVDFLKSLDLFPSSGYRNQMLFFLFFLSIPLIFLFYQLSNFIKRKGLKDTFINNHDVKIIVFSIIWLLSPLFLSLFLRTFSTRYLYISVIPLSIILSLLCVKVIQMMIRRFRESANSGSNSLLIFNISLSGLIFLFMLSCFIVYIPSPRAMDRCWGDINNMNIAFIHKFEEMIHDLPDGATIHLHNVPLIGLHTYTIQSWLNLTHPLKKITVDIVRSGQKGVHSFQDLRFEVENVKGKDMDIDILYGKPKR